MPRKSARKEVVKDNEDVKVAEQDSTPRRSGRKSDDSERARRSSTAAQTAASVADSKEVRSTRNKTSPSEGRRTREVETPATRVKSSRRSTGRVNYKESDGEEDASNPKNEDNFECNDYEESDSDDNAKKSTKRGAKSTPRGRGAKQKAKSPRSSTRGRKPGSKKKNEPIVVSDSEASEEEGKSPVDVDSEESSKPNRKRPRKTSATETEKSTRRSGRTPAVEQISRRPSRNKQIKKYTEVEESDEGKSDEEVLCDDEVKEEESTSRKRKREESEETAANKKPKREKSAKLKPEIQEENPEVEEKIKALSEETKVEKSEDKKKIEEEEEPMEIDETEAEKKVGSPKSENVKVENEDSQNESVAESEKESKEATEKVDASESENSQDVVDETPKIEETNTNLPKVDAEDTQQSKTSSQYSDEIEDGSEENTPSDVQEEPLKADSNLKPVNCIDSKPESLASKEATGTAVNGENLKSTVASAPCPEPEVKSSEELPPPKQNGSHEESDLSQTLRRYIVNPAFSEDVRVSLKDKTFGVASYNLQGLEAVNKDKLLQELSKLQASVLCFQDVSKALYHEVLESNLDMLGFKGVGSWPKGSQHTGLATFYKTSVFQLASHSETSLQKLLEQEIELGGMDDASRENFIRNLNKCGNVLFVLLTAVLGNRQLIVGNVDLPSSNVSLHTMQISCLSQELVKISEAMTKPLLLCGELNIVENKVPYQLLRHGSLTESMLEELKNKSEGSFSEMASTFESFLKKSSLRPSCKLWSCYATVLGKELAMPNTQVTSSNLVWFTPDCLRTIGVLDVAPEFAEDEYPVSLKADLSFSV